MVIRMVLVITVVATSGCGIKRSVHDRALSELQACQGTLDASEVKRKVAGQRIDELEGQLGKLAGDTESLSEANREATGRITRLSKEKAASEAELATLRTQREATERRLAEYRKLENALSSLKDAGKLEIAFRKGLMVLELPSSVLFPSGRARLSKAGKRALADLLGGLSQISAQRLMVAGHTDAVPIRSSRFKNGWHLSTSRAVSVVDYMIASGVDPTRLTAAGHGEFDPIADNETKDGRAKNRRIEIILLPDLSELPAVTPPQS